MLMVCMEWRRHLAVDCVTADDISGLLRPVASLSQERTLDLRQETALNRELKTRTKPMCVVRKRNGPAESP